MLRYMRIPQIINVQEYYIEFEKTYIITDYCEGQILKAAMYDAVRLDDPFSERVIAMIIFQLLKAVNTLHWTGICHRDI